MESVVIAAPHAQVWGVLSDIDGWWLASNAEHDSLEHLGSVAADGGRSEAADPGKDRRDTRGRGGHDNGGRSRPGGHLGSRRADIAGSAFRCGWARASPGASNRAMRRRHVSALGVGDVPASPGGADHSASLPASTQRSREGPRTHQDRAALSERRHRNPVTPGLISQLPRRWSAKPVKRADSEGRPPTQVALGPRSAPRCWLNCVEVHQLRVDLARCTCAS